MGTEPLDAERRPAPDAIPWAPVLLVALVLRAAWAVAIPVVPISDSNIYDILARNLVAGLGYAWGPGEPTAYWPVGTSYLYSLLYRAFGVDYAPIVALNVVLGVGTVAMTMALTRRWFGPRAAIRAGWLMALWPSQVQFTTVLASEQPFVFLMLAAMLGYPAGPSRWFPRAVATGVLLAGASYLRPTALLLPAVIALPHVVADRRYLGHALRLAVIGLAMAACILPWTWRNRQAFGEAVLISTNGGVNTWMGNSPGTTGEYRRLPPETERMGEVERDRYLSARAADYIRRHPGRFAARSAVKLVRLHERESIGIAWNLQGLSRRFPPAAITGLKLFSNLYWWTALALGLGGALALARAVGPWRALLHPTVLLWGYFAGLHAVTVIQDRYHFPVIPAIAALGGYLMARPGAARGPSNVARAAVG